MSAITDTTALLTTSIDAFKKALVTRTPQILVKEDITLASATNKVYTLATLATALGVDIANLDLATLDVETMIESGTNNWIDSDNFIDIEFQNNTTIQLTNTNVTSHKVRVLITVLRKAV